MSGHVPDFIKIGKKVLYKNKARTVIDDVPFTKVEPITPRRKR